MKMPFILRQKLPVKVERERVTPTRLKNEKRPTFQCKRQKRSIILIN